MTGLGLGLGIGAQSGYFDPLTPVNTVQPAITGTAGTIGSTMTTSTGTWTNTPDSYTEQFYRNGVAIGGATGTTYVTVTADNGMNLSSIVTALKAGHPSGVRSSAPVLIGTALTITGTPGAATQGSAYSFTPTASGGNGTNAFALTGTLPTGLSFSTSTGAITGTPTVPGTTTGLNITVTNLAGSASLGAFSIVVSASGGSSNAILDLSDGAMTGAAYQYGVM